MRVLGGIFGILAVTAFMLLLDAPTLQNLPDKRRYQTVYGVLLALFVLLSVTEVVAGEYF